MIAVSAGGDRFTFVATNESGESVMDCAEIYDEMDGTYKGTCTLKTSGPYSVAITFGGQHVQGSPFHISVAPGPAHPPKCSLDIWSAFAVEDVDVPEKRMSLMC